MTVRGWQGATAVALLAVLALTGPAEVAPSEQLGSAMTQPTVDDAVARGLLAGAESLDGDIKLVSAPAAALPAPAITAAGGGPVPEKALAAYEGAADGSPGVRDGCEVRWQVLAGIGKVESDHGRGGGAQGVTADGTVWPSIRGPQLDGGAGFAHIGDTDAGRWDGDVVFDRAVGPMQFLPTSWQTHGHDGNGDGTANPNNLFDAAFGAVDHLCVRAPGDYTQRGDLIEALYRYNPSMYYVATVMAWIDVYDRTGVGRPTPQLASEPPAGVAVAGAEAAQVVAAESGRVTAAEPSPSGSGAADPGDAGSAGAGSVSPQPAGASEPAPPAVAPSEPPSAPEETPSPADAPPAEVTPAPDAEPAPDAAPDADERTVPEPFASAIADTDALVAELDAAEADSDELAAARLVGAWWALADWCRDAGHDDGALGCDELAGDTLLTLTGADPRAQAVPEGAEHDAARQAGAEAARRALGLPEEEVAAPLDREGRPEPGTP